MTAKERAVYLVEHFNYRLEIKDYKKAKHCAIFTAHQQIKETYELKRITYLKEVINEIEKL
jgi:hypothetical protein